MELNLIKYKKPIVWFDTNFVIMARKRDSRVVRLMEFLKEKRGEYFLVEGDDAELLMGNGNVKDYSRLLAGLSFGASFLPYSHIEQFQFQSVSRALLAGENMLNLEVNDYLKKDPVEALKSVEEAGFIVRGQFAAPYMKLLHEKTKKNIFEDLVKAGPRGVSIEDQQKLEADTPAKMFRQFLLSMLEKKKAMPGLTLQEIFVESQQEEGEFASYFEFVSTRIRWWRDAGGARDFSEALEQTYKFITSDAFKDMPFNRINSILWGDIYVGGEPIKDSDYWDVKHMSAVFPFCNIIFTDNRMRLRLQQYELNTEYRVEVYSAQTIGDFFTKHQKSL